ncbi:MAG: 50S ribosomal protein L9 [Eubacterium sp.]|nr:50S ribosomal protein L9 [Eubacterium sp.]
MKVILLEDVKSLGKKGDLVEVNNGYARNYILPKKLGVEASKKNINDLKLAKAHEEKVAAAQLEEAKELAGKLAEKAVTISIKVGEGGKAFGAVSSKEIAAAVKDQLNLAVDKKKIVVKEPIKTVGEHEVKVKLHPEVTAQLKVNVQGQ